MAVALARIYSLDSTPNLGTSIYHGCGPKKKKKKKKENLSPDSCVTCSGLERLMDPTSGATDTRWKQGSEEQVSALHLIRRPDV